MDWFLYDNSLRHERVNNEVLHYLFQMNGGFVLNPSGKNRALGGRTVSYTLSTFPISSEKQIKQNFSKK